MTEPTPETRASAGAAEAGSAPLGLTSIAFATEYVEPGGDSQGVTFTSPHPIGGAYPPAPPLPAEEQHRQGLQPLAAEHELATREAE